VTLGLPNGIEFFAACLATWKLGATPQPISARLPALERRAILGSRGPRWPSRRAAGLPGRPVLAPATSRPALDDGPLPDVVSRECAA